MFIPVEKMNINQCMLKESRSLFKSKNEVKKHFKNKKKRTKTKTEINDKWTLNFKGANTVAMASARLLRTSLFLNT